MVPRTGEEVEDFGFIQLHTQLMEGPVMLMAGRITSEGIRKKGSSVFQKCNRLFRKGVSFLRPELLRQRVKGSHGVEKLRDKQTLGSDSKYFKPVWQHNLQDLVKTWDPC